MERKSITDLMIEIKKLLEKESLSINGIARITKTQWRTARKAIESLKQLGIIKESPGKTNRDERIFTTRKITHG